jgi:hypothetical protein
MNYHAVNESNTFPSMQAMSMWIFATWATENRPAETFEKYPDIVLFIWSEISEEYSRPDSIPVSTMLELAYVLSKPTGYSVE